MQYITVVPAVRTIPGVEQFDYAIDDAADIQRGDVLLVPFRKQETPAIVIERKTESAFASKTIFIKDPRVFLHLGALAAKMLFLTAQRTSTSLPTVFHAWIRTVPKRAIPLPPRADPTPIQTGIPIRETRYVLKRWHDSSGLLAAARASSGRTLILTAWQHRADLLAKELHAPALHADVADGAAWNALRHFCTEPSATVVTTRIGGWLACCADTVLIDEPENDDFKSDESSPRMDTRWFVETCGIHRKSQTIIAFSTTPRLSTAPEEWNKTPLIDLALTCEPRLRRGMSNIEGLSARAYNDILQALENTKSVTIVHAVSGDRARIVCRDCHWSATCISCSFPLTAHGSTGLCRNCGRKQTLSIECPSCHGSDFTRSAVGRDRLAQQCHAAFASELVRVVTPAELQTSPLPCGGLIIITEVSLLGGVIEDTRRRERLLITWRRLAAVFFVSQSTVLIQGSEEALSECRTWLTSEGVVAAWNKEYAERKLFGFPPAARMAKILIDGTEEKSQLISTELSTKLPSDWELRGPYPVAFRAVTRSPRWVIQLILPSETQDDAILAILNPLKSHAIIDLDPIAFFS